MGIDPKSLTDKQVDLIGDAKQRRAVVKARGFETQAKLEAKAEAKNEKEMHEKYAGFLNRYALPFIHADMFKKATIRKGTPDFTVTGGETYGFRSMYGEFKMPGKTLSPEQEHYIRYLRSCGCAVFIWYDYVTARNDTAKFFGFALHPE